MVGALDFRSRGRWFDPSRCVVSLDKKLHSTLSLFSQGYKLMGTSDHNTGG